MQARVSWPVPSILLEIYVHEAYDYCLLVKGINLAFATLLLENGCNVLIADLALRPEARVVVDKYSSRSGSARAVFQKTNVIEWAQLEEMFVVAEREFGEVDIVCPGAGVYEEVRVGHFIGDRRSS